VVFLILSLGGGAVNIFEPKKREKFAENQTTQATRPAIKHVAIRYKLPYKSKLRQLAV